MLKTLLVATIAAASVAAIPAFAAGSYDYSGSYVGDLAGGKSAMAGTAQPSGKGYDYSGSYVGDLAGGKSAMRGTAYRTGKGYDYSGSWVGDLAGGKSAMHGVTYYVQPDGSLSTQRPAH